MVKIIQLSIISHDLSEEAGHFVIFYHTRATVQFSRVRISALKNHIYSTLAYANPLFQNLRNVFIFKVHGKLFHSSAYFFGVRIAIERVKWLRLMLHIK